MFDRKELAELIDRIQIRSPRQRTREGVAVATLFASQILTCALLLHAGYSWFGAPGVYWAIVSAILVIQPGVTQSLTASAIRIAANLVGALTGLIVASTLGTNSWQVAAAMILVIFGCELMRLEYGLRTACVSVIIVMTANGGVDVLASSIDRFIAVVTGCGLAITVQLAVDRIRKRLGLKDQLAPYGAAPPVTVQQKRSSSAEE